MAEGHVNVKYEMYILENHHDKSWRGRGSNPCHRTGLHLTAGPLTTRSKLSNVSCHYCLHKSWRMSCHVTVTSVKCKCISLHFATLRLVENDMVYPLCFYVWLKLLSRVSMSTDIAHLARVCGFAHGKSPLRMRSTLALFCKKTTIFQRSQCLAFL